jgi:hypothetical protein
MALCRIGRTMHTIAVNLARLYIWQTTVPDLIGLFRQHNALRFDGRIWRIKET